MLAHLRASRPQSVRSECCRLSIWRHSLRVSSKTSYGRNFMLTVGHLVVRGRRQWALFCSCGLTVIRRRPLLSTIVYSHHNDRLQIGRAPNPCDQSASISLLLFSAEGCLTNRCLQVRLVDTVRQSRAGQLIPVSVMRCRSPLIGRRVRGRKDFRRQDRMGSRHLGTGRKGHLVKLLAEAHRKQAIILDLSNAVPRVLLPTGRSRWSWSSVASIAATSSSTTAALCRMSVSLKSVQTQQTYSSSRAVADDLVQRAVHVQLCACNGLDEKSRGWQRVC